MGPCHHYRAESRKRRTLGAGAVLCKTLAVQKCVTCLALRPRKLPGLIHITDHISYINHWTCYFYCKERVGLNWGGLLSLAVWQTHAVKFDEPLKVCRTLTELRTALSRFVKCVKVREPGLLAEPRTEQPWCNVNKHTYILYEYVCVHVHKYVCVRACANVQVCVYWKQQALWGKLLAGWYIALYFWYAINAKTYVKLSNL